MANTFNHNDKVVITDGGSVGIGTTSPGYTLQVGSTSANSSATIIGNSTAGIEIRTNSAGGRIAALEQYFGNEGSLWLYLSNTAKVLVRANGNSYFNGGNVGIGTTSPGAKLTVDGSVRSRYVILGGTSGDSPDNTIEFVSALNSSAYIGGHINYHGAGNLTLVNGGGNVGIGTTSPSRKLEVQGDFYANGTNGALTTELSQSNLYLLNLTRSTTSLITAGSVGIGTTSPSAKLDVNGEFSFLGGVNGYWLKGVQGNSAPGGNSPFLALVNNNTISSATYGWLFYDSNSDGSFNLYCRNNSTTSSQVLTISRSTGNVGIGTTSPDSKLTVSSSGSALFRMIRNQNFFGFEATDTSSGGYGLFDYQTQSYDIFFKAGNVGIGTTSPAKKLDVRGGYFVTSDGGSNQVAFVQGGNGYAYFGNLNAGPVAIGNSENYRTIVVDGDKVGIGTSSPATKLNIDIGSGGTNGIAGLRIGGTNNYPSLELGIYGAYGGMVRSFGNDIHYFAGHWQTIGNEASENHSHYWYTSKNGSSDWSSVKMELDHDGNLGIGTTSPGAKLHVNGSFKTTLDGTYDMGILNEYVSTYVTRTRFGRNASGSSSNLEIYYDIAGAEEARITRNYPNAVLKFNKGEDTHMIINAAGNVGIGTTSPSSILDVRGASAYFHLGNTSDTRYVDIGHWATGNIQVEAGNGNLYLKTQTSHYLALGTANSERLRITDAGNVGIGTTSPSQLLHIYGGAPTPMIESTTVGANANLRFKTTARTWSIGPNQGLSNSFFEIYDSTAFATRVTIDTSGNVGIGTTSPVAALDVSGSAVVRTNLTVNKSTNENYARLNVWDPSAGEGLNRLADFTNGTDVNLNIYTTGVGATTKYAEIASYSTLPLVFNNVEGGNVGIGTNTPSGKLEIFKSNTTINYSNAHLRLNNDSTQTTIYFTSGTVEKGSIRVDSSGNFVLNSANKNFYFNNDFGTSSTIHLINTSTTFMSVTSTGNVGFGTTSPSYKIDVSGGAIAIRGNAAGNSLRFDDSLGNSRNAMYVDTSNYLNIGNANYAGVKFVQTATAPNTGAFDGQSVQQAVGTTDDGVVLAAPDAWLAVRVGTTDYAIPMYTTG